MKLVFRVLSALMVILLVAGTAAGIEVEDIGRGDSPAVVALLEEFAGSIQTGVVKTGLFRGVTWEEKVWGALTVGLFAAVGFWLHYRWRGRSGSGWQVSAIGQPAEEAGFRPFTLGRRATGDGGQEGGRAFRA